MNRLIITPFVVALLLTLAIGCDRTTPAAPQPLPTTVPSSSTQPSASQQQVVIDNFTFTPAELTIPVGTTVTWINHDDVPHTATSTATPPAFNSKALDTDEKFSFTFTTPGTYPYFCAVHTHMTAKITVK